MVTPARCKDIATLARLWLHETQRVFYDRLINKMDQAWYEDLSCGLLSRHLGVSSTRDQLFGENSVIFADFGRPGVEIASRTYELVELQPITRVLTDMLDDYNVSIPG